MKQILISGSIAYDNLYTYSGVFQNELIPDKKPISVAFLVNDRKIEFGGCSGNITFNGKLLGEDFIMLGIAGKDFDEYEKWFKKNRIDTSRIIRVPNKFTSLASVITDKEGQQITIFHEGASAESKHYKKQIKNHIKNSAKNTIFALVSPNNRDFMFSSIEACLENSFPYFFDPGQALPVFYKEELINITKKSAGIFLNEYELALFSKKTGCSLKNLTKLCRLVVLTLAEKGSKIYFNGKEIRIPAVKAKKIINPTGCGDAFRAGFLIGIKDFFPNKLTPQILSKAGAMGAKIATACISSSGTQNHTF